MGGCGPAVITMMDPNQTPCSISIFVYLRYGPKYSPLTGAILNKATPECGSCGGGCMGKLLVCIIGGDPRLVMPLSE